MLKKFIFVTAFLMAFANIAQADQSNKVLICHATSSLSNPSVLISISPNAVEAQLAQGSTFPRLLDDGSYSCTVEVVPE